MCVVAGSHVPHVADVHDAKVDHAREVARDACAIVCSHLRVALDILDDELHRARALGLWISSAIAAPSTWSSAGGRAHARLTVAARALRCAEARRSLLVGMRTTRIRRQLVSRSCARRAGTLRRLRGLPRMSARRADASPSVCRRR
jgi:hypothetical protein